MFQVELSETYCALALHRGIEPRLYPRQGYVLTIGPVEQVGGEHSRLARFRRQYGLNLTRHNPQVG